MILAPRKTPAAARSGFTLLEVLIVVAILVVLAGVASVYVFRYLDDAKVDRAKADVQTLTRAAQSYEIRFGELPAQLSLLAAPPDSGKPFVETDALNDPWGKPYQYDPAGPMNGGLKPDVWAVTPDGQKVGNWSVRAG